MSPGSEKSSTDHFPMAGIGLRLRRVTCCSRVHSKVSLKSERLIRYFDVATPGDFPAQARTTVWLHGT